MSPHWKIACFVYGDVARCEESTSIRKLRHNFHVTDYQMDLCVIQPGYVPLLHTIFWKGESIGFPKPFLSAYIYPQMRRPFTVMATRRSFLFFGPVWCLELFWFTIMLLREVFLSIFLLLINLKRGRDTFLPPLEHNSKTFREEG